MNEEEIKKYKDNNQIPLEVKSALQWLNDNRDDFTDTDRIAIDALTKHINNQQ
jgi:hypothetical protein|tara:strand:- start:4592 stop:4750 length:159 start_codon:yes stop_codon:yes gene_type:complete